MRTFGLIGYPLSHSFSQKYFSEKFKRENITDAEYKLFELKNIAELPSIIKNNFSLYGLNVTIPYKETVIPFLDELDETAKAVGAVNTIKIIRNSSLRSRIIAGEACLSGRQAISPNKKIASVAKQPSNGGYKSVGYNTDVYGFRESLKPILQEHYQKALILGTGGAAKAVEYVLKQFGIECLFVTRTHSPLKRGIKGDFKNLIVYEEINKHIINSYYLIINATPSGMYPEINNCPAIPYESITKKHLLYDLIYNPEETLFLRKGKEKDATTQNGLTMLRLQAKKAFEIWNS